MLQRIVVWPIVILLGGFLMPLSLPQLILDIAIYYWMIGMKKLFVLAFTMMGCSIIYFFNILEIYSHIPLIELATLSFLFAGTIQIIASKKSWNGFVQFITVFPALALAIGVAILIHVITS